MNDQLTKIIIKHRTDQWNADDFISGPRTFTIAEVKPGKAEQQYDIELVEGEGKAWRPPVQVLMLLVAAWGDEAKVWRGRRVTLYRDESVKFGPDQVGGIRVSHMSDLPDGKPFKTKVTATRGKRITVSAEPLVISPAEQLRVAKQRLWQIAQSHDEPMDWLTTQAAEHNLSLDTLADVQQLIEKVQS